MAVPALAACLLLSGCAVPGAFEPTSGRGAEPVLSPLCPMSVDGLPPAPAVVVALQPAADLNGDGMMDFVAQVEVPEEYRIERRPVLSVPGGRWAMAPATQDAFRRGRDFWRDLDGDGRTDVAFGRLYNGTRIIGGGIWPTWSHREADGSWRQFTFDAALAPADDLVACADLDGDGRPDFVVASPWGGGVLWNAGAPGRREPLAWDRRLIAGSLSDADALVTDLDGDGRPDLVVWSRDGAAAQGWHNDGARGWSPYRGLERLGSRGPGAALPLSVDGRRALGVLVDRDERGFRGFEVWFAAGAYGDPWVRLGLEPARLDGASAMVPFALARGAVPGLAVVDGESWWVVSPEARPLGRFRGVPAGTVPFMQDGRTVLLAPPAAPGEPIRWTPPAPGSPAR